MGDFERAAGILLDQQNILILLVQTEDHIEYGWHRPKCEQDLTKARLKGEFSDLPSNLDRQPTSVVAHPIVCLQLGFCVLPVLRTIRICFSRVFQFGPNL
jgi:hypothetical protein